MTSLAPIAFTHRRREYHASWRFDERRGRYVLCIRPTVPGGLAVRDAKLAMAAFKRRPDFTWPKAPLQ
jgi:hypothetical protein